MKRRALLGSGTTLLPLAAAGCLRLSSNDEATETADEDGPELESEGGSAESTMQTARENEAGADDVEEDAVGPADVVVTALSFTDPAEVGRDVYVVLEIENRGGEPGTFSDSVVVAGPNASAEADVSVEVDGGERTRAKAGPFAFDLAGEYELSLAAGDATETATLGPRSVPVGESLYDGEMLVSVDGISLRESVFYRRDSVWLSGYGASTFAAPTKHVLAVVSVTVENQSTETLSLPEGAFALRDGDWYGFGENVPSFLLGVDGERFTDGGVDEVEPSETRSGYYLGKLPREAARGEVAVTSNFDEASTPPEREWVLAVDDDGDRALPNVAVQSVDAPDETEGGRPYDVSVTVANDGKAAGTFRAAAEYHTEEGWQQLTTSTTEASLDTDAVLAGTLREQIPAGETRTLTLRNSSSYLGAFKYRLAGTEQSWETDFVPADLQLNQTARIDQWTELTVTDVRTDDALPFETEDGDVYESTPREGYRYVSVRVVFERAEESVPAGAPDLPRLSLSTDGNDSFGERLLPDNDVAEDWFSYPAGSLQDRTRVEGWLIYEAPANDVEGDFGVRWVGAPNGGDPLRVLWS